MISQMNFGGGNDRNNQPCKNDRKVTGHFVKKELYS